ncbi:UPF0748 protein YngK [Clostridia bacterium]|nr:UPF0748 protein YngK [Clostridia bacterium]
MKRCVAGYIVRFLGIVVAIVFCFGGSALAAKKTKEEVRAVWISYYEIEESLKAEDEATFKVKAGKLLDELEERGINRVVFHVRSHADAFYPSRIFPWSKYISGEQGRALDYDPLKIMIDETHAREMTFEAWINPYRIKQGSDSFDELSEDSPAVRWLKKNSRKVRKYDDHGARIVFNPAYVEVRTLVVNGVKEIVKKYDVDAVSFDDHFYQTADPDFDAYEYNKYTKSVEESDSKLSLAQWRRKNVDILIKRVYKAIKKIKPNVKFGTSPGGNRQRNRDEVFIDTQKWCSSKGYIDFICPQIYFGFTNTAHPFDENLKEWVDDIKIDGVDLFVGLAAYKVGNEKDTGTSESDEWVNDGINTLKKQIKQIRSNSKCKGFYIFSLKSLLTFDEFPWN